MVPMRDGVRLATDVFRPARDGVPIDEQPGDDLEEVQISLGTVFR